MYMTQYSWSLLIVTLFVAGCGSDNSSKNDEQDGGSDTDTDSDTETDTHEPMTVCQGGLLDPETGLCWQDPFSETLMPWQDLISYCENLELGGFTDWYLPNIDELRTLIRGCSFTEPDGECGAQEGFQPLYWEEEWETFCLGCASLQGPGENGCYWDVGLGGACEGKMFFASSGYTDEPTPNPDEWEAGMVVRFDLAGVAGEGSSRYARCVRQASM